MAKSQKAYTDHSDELVISFVGSFNGVLKLAGMDVSYREVDDLEAGDGSIRSRVLVELNQKVVELVREHLAGYEYNLTDGDLALSDERSSIAYSIADTQIYEIDTRHITVESKGLYARGINE